LESAPLPGCFSKDPFQATRSAIIQLDTDQVKHLRLTIRCLWLTIRR
jgi:hypothetical protein